MSWKNYGSNWKDIGSVLALVLVVALVLVWKLTPRQVKPENRYIDQATRAKRIADLGLPILMLKPGEEKTGWMVAKGFKVLPRVSLQSTFPVSVAWIPEAYAGALPDSAYIKQYLSHCPLEHVKHTIFTCPLDTTTGGYVLYVRDERSSQFVPDPQKDDLLNEVHIEARAAYGAGR